MKKILYTAFLSLALLPAATRAQQRLVWEENFDGPALNPNNWTFEIGDGCAKSNCGWGNNELEYYTNSTNNVRIENGHLVIEARRENMGGKPFTSARLKTFGRVSFRYGTLEARIKVPPVANGLWPAFWLLGATGGTWPHNGEADILEMGFAGDLASGNANKTVNATTHWWTTNPGGYTGHASYSRDTVAGVNLSDDYHLYKLVWDPNFLTVYLDGTAYYQIAISGGNGLDAFQNPFYILLNLAVGGNYPGITDPNAITAPLPGDMLVDYIRLYQDVTHGDQLILGSDNAPEGNYGVFTDNTPVSDKIVLGQNGANLFFWNNIVNITTPAPVPFEGSNVWAVRAAAGNWFGLGIANNDVNLSNFAAGSLKFNMKTTSTATFKVGISTDAGEGWVNFDGTNGEHGLVRDGQWHQVTIPVSEFTGVDLMTVDQVFMFSGDAPAATSDFYFDNIYYTGGVSANPAPHVAITNLANDTLFTVPAAIPIQTNASDPNGSIARVQFFNGDTYLGVDSVAPFNFTWNTSTQGVANLIVKATDNQGKTTTSQPVRVFIAATGNTAPHISITAPTAATPFIKPANVNITANATDDGSIYKVEFYNGATLLGTVTSAPYTFAWSAVDQGTYTITAKAYDNGKLSTVSPPVTITVQSNQVTADKYGIYSEDASINTKLTYGQDANLYVWNNLTTIASATPFEGAEVMAFEAAPNNWFGLGVANDVRDLSHFATGSLYFQFKTTYQGSFRFSVISQTGQTDINFAAGEQKLGLVRDGQWHQVTIPVSMLTGTDLTTVTQAFTFSGDGNATTGDFFIDNVYYAVPATSTGPTGGTNLALHKSVTVTSFENGSFTGPNAVDGDINTRWSSAFSDPQSITVDLGADYNIGEVKITWETAAASNYLVQLSNDTTNWGTALKTVSGNTTLVNDHTGLSGHGRYLRVLGTARVTPYGYSIYELEAYGSLHTNAVKPAIATIGSTTDSIAAPKWVANLYPNPVAGSQAQLLSSEPLRQVSLLDISGRTWSVGTLPAKAGGTYNIDVHKLPSGMYILQVTNTKNQTRLLKFIKQ